MAVNRQGFTPEKLKRLAANPFVDKKMLQFIKNRTPGAPQSIGSPAKNSSLAAPRKFVMSEESAKLIAAAIKAMLRG